MFYKKKPKEIPVQEPVQETPKPVETDVAYIKFFTKGDGVEVDYKYPYGMEEDFVKMLLYIQSPEIQEYCLQNLPKTCISKFNELRSTDRPVIEPIYALRGKNMNVRDS